jgi:GNAT superfamily N-acetyltransferase
VAAAQDDGELQVLVEELEYLVSQALDNAAAEIGPTIRWTDPYPHDDTWATVIQQIDLDGYTDDDPAGASHIDDWEGSALARAARAYRRECRWDFSPDEAGIWLIAVAPYSSIGGSQGTTYSGTLTGFAIIHDRDRDGEYESLAHLWTARAWRRRGVAADLVRQARERFPVSQVEGPATQAGRLMLLTCAPDLIEQ